MLYFSESYNCFISPYSPNYPPSNSTSYDSEESDTDDEFSGDHDYNVPLLRQGSKKYINKGRWAKEEVNNLLNLHTLCFLLYRLKLVSKCFINAIYLGVCWYPCYPQVGWDVGKTISHDNRVVLRYESVQNMYYKTLGCVKYLIHKFQFHTSLT